MLKLQINIHKNIYAHMNIYIYIFFKSIRYRGIIQGLYIQLYWRRMQDYCIGSGVLSA